MIGKCGLVDSTIKCEQQIWHISKVKSAMISIEIESNVESMFSSMREFLEHGLKCARQHENWEVSKARGRRGEL